MDRNIVLKNDNQTIIEELERVGFIREEIQGALDWLEGLSEAQNQITQPRNVSPAIRHYLPIETEHLGIEGQGFLLYLEQLGIVDATSREVVIDRLMVLNPAEINIGRIKWVVLLVLFNQPDKKSALSMLQEMVLSDAFDVLH